MDRTTKNISIVEVDSPSSSLADWLPTKVSKELFIGLCGPVGVDLNSIQQEFKQTLTSAGYTVEHIKLSDLIKSRIDTVFPSFSAPSITDSSAIYSAYRLKQQQGNYLREKEGNGVGASLVIEEVRNLRGRAIFEHVPKRDLDKMNDLEREKKIEGLHALVANEKRAYIINQLKRPEEVEALRGLYKNRFYLFTGLATEENRRCNLTSISLTGTEASTLMELDRKESESSGQRVEKTILSADFFLNSNEMTGAVLTASIGRFIALIHGVNGHPPSQQEFGMHQAHTASMGSLCLSRQVGAAILDTEGNILAVGRNDVPKFGGGLYELDGGEGADHRCVNKPDSKCYNDHHKDLLKSELKEIIFKTKHLDDEDWDDIYKRISEHSKVSSLIEYSRSVHAEMDAIISIARKGVRIAAGATLYTTVFPCHNCARHIVAAGIESVVYIEPYEKSLALKLHQDSISLVGEDNKVKVAPFHGVAPRLYQTVFGWTGDRKENGKPTNKDVSELELINTQHLVTYLRIERAYIANLNDDKSTPAPAA